MKQALVVIDVQEIFFLEPQNFLYDKERVVENINKLITKAHEKISQLFLFNIRVQRKRMKCLKEKMGGNYIRG
ncbi:hypothetical protein AB1280_21920 [Bacillus sp. S10(2024)]